MIGPVGLALTNSTFTYSGSAATPGAEPLARAHDRGQGLQVPGVAHEQVEEPRARHLHAVDARAEPLAEVLPEPLGDRARGVLQRGRQQHRGVGGVVAEVGLAGAVERGCLGAVAQGGGRVADGVAELCEGVRAHLSSGRARGRGSCVHGRAARAEPPARAGAGASSGRATSATRPRARARGDRRR